MFKYGKMEDPFLNFAGGCSNILVFFSDSINFLHRLLVFPSC